MPDQTQSPKILYCRCAYAQVVPEAVKDGVLKSLCASGVAFETVSDLCEMAARRDPRLKRIAEGGAVKIAACHPRAVKWLFHSAGAPLPEGEGEGEGVEILNMREESATDIAAKLFHREEVSP